MYKTTDNNQGKKLSEIFKTEETSGIHDDLSKIANKKIGELISRNENLLVFPSVINEYNDDLDSNHILNLLDETIYTNNVLGFVGCNNTELTISSRFHGNGNDYFLHYMLQKVFSINMFDLKHSSEKENIWDFLIYLFPFLLKKALTQGLFKEYQKREYNNANVRGAIDVGRHIRKNLPFCGKITYQTREHSYDNNITQLIRHTIEHIRQHKFGGNILICNTDTQNAVLQIVNATRSYNRNHRIAIINRNIKPQNHPFFTEYKILQKICLQILRYDGLTYGKEKDKVYGLLFDGAWLWEEYLNIILQKEHFIHPRNKGKALQKKPIHLFIGNSYKRFPDFYCNIKEMVLDAKYKHLEHAGEIGRDDIHQIITYMYVLQSKSGGFIFPIKKSKEYDWSKPKSLGTLNGYRGNINLFGMPINQDIRVYSEFCDYMRSKEDDLLSNIIEIIKT